MAAPLLMVPLRLEGTKSGDRLRDGMVSSKGLIACCSRTSLGCSLRIVVYRSVPVVTGRADAVILPVGRPDASGELRWWSLSGRPLKGGTVPRARSAEDARPPHCQFSLRQPA